MAHWYFSQYRLGFAAVTNNPQILNGLKNNNKDLFLTYAIFLPKVGMKALLIVITRGLRMEEFSSQTLLTSMAQY